MNNFFFLFLIILNLYLIINFNRASKIINLFDKPDFKRKIHKSKIACYGGLVIYINLSLLFLYLIIQKQTVELRIYDLYNISDLIFFYIILTLFFLIGYADDKFNLNPTKKLIIFLILLSVFFEFHKNINVNFLIFNLNSYYFDISLYSKYFTVFCVLIFINAFNMYDGSNLQVALFSYSLLIYFVLKLVNLDLFLITLLISLTTFIFLNYKNKLFLGDNGSLLLAFLISFLILKFYNNGIIKFADEVFLLLWLPVLDLLRLFVIRIINKKSPFVPDKNHLHHILLKKYKYDQTILILYALYIFPVLFGILLNKFVIGVFLQILLYVVIFYTSKKNDI